jgi:ABC-type nitrate/sulfonate/bicarbonate transport system substrate-binding protein
MDRATGGMVQAGPFSDYAEFLDGVYGIDPVVFEYELAIGPPEVNEIGICFAPTYTAVMSKLLELKFSDSDLTYNNVSCASGPATAAALVANEVQIAVNTPDNMLGLRTAGFDVVMFMTGVSGSFWDVIVHKDIDLSSCDQGDWECNVKLMDGKTGGVVARGAAAEQFMRQLLESAGLDPENTTYVATGLAGTTLAALDSGEIDWSVTFEPAFALGTAMGHQTPFMMRAGELPVELDFPTIIYMTSAEFAASNPNVIQHYAADFEAAVCWALDPANEGELVEIMTGYLGLEADVAAGIHADSKAQWGGCDPMRGALDPVRLQNNVDYTVNRGIADEAASFEDFAIVIPNYGG